MNDKKNLIGKKVHSEDFGGWLLNTPGPMYGTILYMDKDEINVKWVCASGKRWVESIPRDDYLPRYEEDKDIIGK